MMLLLDSQVALWVLDDNPRLSTRARALIADATQVHVSAATVWELTVKAMLGKLTVPDNLADRITRQGLTLLNITAEHAEALRSFRELTRHDPFNRLIVAQAERAGLRLLTADKVLIALDRGFIIDATA
ncbi:type II toxin-antitoxin system VapC family toxin [Amycolatopsis alkalitolerans]|uniref:Type II toxin-antitoxin system VapC family toxin n=1 Tax=Amycolatopsis alkalitolerans TaxID=2547244 RepID=A0A5C4MA29_9PSEU|nr:type II toxin-antitoxin system VapC family toxin [Amycolatopsis alkalitolerans]TNC29069.1 type II toxin-antitoxin system VapC family toxin [Amycolatopsis alkalitolerans]